ncbi:unnamed protein product, partial [Allacma fusca]
MKNLTKMAPKRKYKQYQKSLVNRLPRRTRHRYLKDILNGRVSEPILSSILSHNLEDGPYSRESQEIPVSDGNINLNFEAEEIHCSDDADDDSSTLILTNEER